MPEAFHPVASRVGDLDRLYRRRMGVALLLAGACAWGLLTAVPVSTLRQVERQLAAIAGPLRIMPRIDIPPDEVDPRQETAAPLRVAPVDFVAVEIEIVDHAAGEPAPVPVRMEEIPDPQVNWTEDDLQTEIRTTGLPVLSRADFEIIHFERPLYPPAALALGIEGTVRVALLVGENGVVLHAYVLDPGRLPLLESSALEALSAARFRPHLVEGRPTPFWVNIPVAFEIVG